MDKEVGTLINCMDEEVMQLFHRWKIFRQLFDSGKENLDLLNRSGSNVFALLESLIIDDFYLRLSRLTDPESTAGYENLSIRYFLRKIEPLANVQALENLRTKLEKLEALTEKLRIHRNKRIAHLDRKHAIEAKPLPSVEYSDLKDALELVQVIMQDILVVLFNYSGYHEPSIAYGCDGNHLLHVLRDAHEHRV